MTDLAIVNTRCANLASVVFAFERLGVAPLVTADPTALRAAGRRDDDARRRGGVARTRQCRAVAGTSVAILRPRRAHCRATTGPVVPLSRRPPDTPPILRATPRRTVVAISRVTERGGFERGVRRGGARRGASSDPESESEVAGEGERRPRLRLRVPGVTPDAAAAARRGRREASGAAAGGAREEGPAPEPASASRSRARVPTSVRAASSSSDESSMMTARPLLRVDSTGEDAPRPPPDATPRDPPAGVRRDDAGGASGSGSPSSEESADADLPRPTL